MWDLFDSDETSTYLSDIANSFNIASVVFQIWHGKKNKIKTKHKVLTNI